MTFLMTDPHDSHLPNPSSVFDAWHNIIEGEFKSIFGRSLIFELRVSKKNKESERKTSPKEENFEIWVDEGIQNPPPQILIKYISQVS